MPDRSTLDSGNIDQEFYDVLLIMYSQAISKAIELPRNNGKNSERETSIYYDLLFRNWPGILCAAVVFCS